MKSIFSILIVLYSLFLLSCSDDFLTTPPKGQANEDLLLNSEGIDKLLIGVYAVVDGVHGETGIGKWSSSVSNWVFGGVSSDDAYKGTVFGDQNQINPIEGFYVDATNQYVANHWKPFYDGISRANDLLNKLVQVELPESERIHVEAQVKFLRAHFYVELTRVHGPVPYIDENTEDPSLVPNDHFVWPEIEKDLLFAAEHLPHRQTDLGRPTKWSAITYLGYVKLLQNKHSEAKPYLDDVFENGGYVLMPSYEQNYLIAYNNNQESIFEIQCTVNDGYSYDNPYGDTPNGCAGDSLLGMTFMGGSGFYQPSHNLVSSFRVGEDGLPLLFDEYSVDDILPYDPEGKNVLYNDPVDPRLDHTIGRPGVPFLDWGVQEGHSWIRDPSNGGPYINKKPMFLKSEEGSYSNTSGRTFPNANNYRKFKLSHVILWLAECEVEEGNLTRAAELVNLLRNRAKQSNVVTFEDGTPAANYLVEPYKVPFPNQDYARRAVRHEHRLELSMEGYRFYDLVRWGVASDVINTFLQVDGTRMGHLRGAYFTEGQNELWPIPQTQIDITLDRNGQQILIQNPGY